MTADAKEEGRLGHLARCVKGSYMSSVPTEHSTEEDWESRLARTTTVDPKSELFNCQKL